MNHKDKKKAIAVLATASDAGKTFLVAALARWFARQQVNVAPFKAQNMSNNSNIIFKEDSALEISHAQFVQAQAAQAFVDVDMNPILLKPQGNTISQLIVHGKNKGEFRSQEYYKLTKKLFEKVKKSFLRLQEKHDLIIIEGAGSCAEVNLQKKDISNFKIAHFAKAPVLLVANIESGGVFAQILGTLQVLSKKERKQIKGIVINRFRGDANLFKDGIQYIEKKTRIPVIGLLPYIPNFYFSHEDSFSLDNAGRVHSVFDFGKLNIAIIRLPAISHFNDFDRLWEHPAIQVHFLSRPQIIDNYDLLILPASKNIEADLFWLEQQGWKKIIKHRVQQKKALHAIAEGMYMLFENIELQSINQSIKKLAGLSVLKENIFVCHEQIKKVNAKIKFAKQNFLIEGYQMQKYKVAWKNKISPLAYCQNNKDNNEEGFFDLEQKVLATNIHLFYQNIKFLNWFISFLKPQIEKESFEQYGLNLNDQKRHDDKFEKMADHIDKHLDMKKIKKILKIN